MPQQSYKAEPSRVLCVDVFVNLGRHAAFTSRAKVEKPCGPMNRFVHERARLRPGHLTFISKCALPARQRWRPDWSPKRPRQHHQPDRPMASCLCRRSLQHRRQKSFVDLEAPECSRPLAHLSMSAKDRRAWSPVENGRARQLPRSARPPSALIRHHTF